MKAIELNGTHVGQIFPIQWAGKDWELPINSIEHGGIYPGTVELQLRLDETNLLQWRMPADAEVIFVE